METLWQDLRFGLRTLRKNPVFTLVAVLTLALGIGANTAIFGVVNAVVLSPLPYENPDRLVMVWGTTPKKGQDTVVPADFRDWREQSRSFAALAGFGFLPANLTGGEKPERVTAASVTGNFFTTLGVQAAVGRVFAGTEGGDRVAVLSHGLWQRSFGAEGSVIGRTLKINGQLYSVVGVMPAGFAFPDRAELWLRAPRDVPEMPMDVGGDPAEMRGLSYMRAFGRLKPGVEPGQAQAEMDAIARRQAEAYPDTNADRGVSLVSLHEQIVGDVRPALLVLLGGVVLVLMIACANVANLLFARAAAREQEVALRTALGADRGRILRQLLTESLLLAVIAGVCGLLLAAWGVDLLVSVSPGDIPRLDEIGIDGRVLAFTFLVSLLTGVVLGLLPALHGAKTALIESLKGNKSTEGVQRRRTRGVLVVAEVALALVLLVGAGLLMKSFLQLQKVDLGFQPESLLTFQVSLPPAQYPEPHQQVGFFQESLERVRALPGVQASAAVLSPPLTGEDINIPFAIQGQPRPASEEEQRDGFQLVSADYFQAMEIPIVRGRGFSSADMADSAGTIVVSQSMARRYWGSADPIGQRVTYGDPDSPDTKWHTVVGVAGDVKHFGLDQPGRAEAYVPFPQMPLPMMFLVLRTSGAPEGLVPAVRSAITEIDPEQPIASVTTMQDLVDGSVARPRFTSFLLAVFAAVALVLAAVGIYGLMAYSIAQRMHEIGIRMALGARRVDVVRQIVTQGMKLALVGIGLGLASALVLTRVLRSLLFEVAAVDVMTFLAVPLTLMLVALLANSVPALRASRVEPLSALRHE